MSMTDWATISSLATAGGTLVLAVATFSAVRSSNRSARVAEHALQEQARDNYVAPGNIGLWQGAISEADDEARARLSSARAERPSATVDLLYSDQVGDQRTISRFGVVPAGDDRWLANVGRHWNLDHAGPR